MNRHSDAVANLDRMRGIAAYDLFHPELMSALGAVCQRTSTELDMPLVAVQAVLDTATATLASSLGDSPLVALGGGPNELTFCPHVVINAAPFVVDDLTRDPDHADNPAVQGGLIRSYAGVPLRLPNGHILGSYCTMSPLPHTFTDAEITNLEGTATEIVAIIRRYELSPSAH